MFLFWKLEDGRHSDFFLFIYPGATALVSQCLLIIEYSWSQSDTPHSVGLLWTSDHPDAKTSTAQNNHKRQTSMPLAEFEPIIPASERPQTNALDRATTGITRQSVLCIGFSSSSNIILYNIIFIHSVICLTIGATPLPRRFLHIVRSRASSFKWEYPLLPLRSSSSFLRHLPPLLVTSISPFIFPSITCFWRQFLRKMWPIQLAFHFLISCRIFLCSLTPSNTSSFLTWWV